MIVSLIGEPATGKTTIAKAVISHFGTFELVKYKLLRFMISESSKLIVLGIYGSDGIFDGTDRLSMAVQKDALQFCKKYLLKHPEFTVFFEGDRLGNRSFFDAIVTSGIQLEIFITFATEETKAFRHTKRQDSQSEQFKKAKKTKINNIKESFIHTPLQNDTEKQYNNNLQTIIGALSGKTKN